MEDLSLHILDIAENAVTAGATLVEIDVRYDPAGGRLTLSVSDNGCGMEPDFAARAASPFVTTRTTRRIGLGLSLLSQACQDANGSLVVHSEPGKGTRVLAQLDRRHIDCKPLTGMGETLVALIVGNPEVDFHYTADLGGASAEIDTRALRAEAGDLPLCHPRMLKRIRALAAEAEIPRRTTHGGRNHGQDEG